MTHEIWRNLRIAQQIAAIATAFSLPLSTSGQAIAASVFVVLAIATVDFKRFAATIVALKWVGPRARLLLILIVMMTALGSRYATPLLLLTENDEPQSIGSNTIEGHAR